MLYRKENSLRINNSLLTESAQKMVWLVEERGIAGCPWKKELDAIALWIRRYVKQEFLNGNFNTISFNVPENLTKPINMFNSLVIHGTSHLGTKFESGSGFFQYEKLQSVNKEIDAKTINSTKCQIGIECYHDLTGKVFLHSILMSLYHEFNHMYEAFMDAYNNYNVNRFRQSSDKTKIKLPNNNFINKLIYRLYSETEKNALVNNLYGELKGNNISRNEFNEYLPQTSSYGLYRYFYNSYASVIDRLSPQDCKLLLDYFNQYKISLNINNVNSTTAFKNAFKHKTALLLQDLIKRFGKAASLWFDEKEENERNNNESSIISTGWEPNGLGDGCFLTFDGQDKNRIFEVMLDL